MNRSTASNKVRAMRATRVAAVAALAAAAGQVLCFASFPRPGDLMSFPLEVKGSHGAPGKHYAVAVHPRVLIEYDGKMVVLNELSPRRLREGEIEKTPRDMAHRERILRMALSRLGESKYNVFSNNCEHFALWTYTGEPASKQMEWGVKVVAVVGAVVLVALMANRLFDVVATVLGSVLVLGIASAFVWHLFLPVFAMAIGIAAIGIFLVTTSAHVANLLLPCVHAACAAAGCHGPAPADLHCMLFVTLLLAVLGTVGTGIYKTGLGTVGTGVNNFAACVINVVDANVQLVCMSGLGATRVYRATSIVVFAVFKSLYMALVSATNGSLNLSAKRSAELDTRITKYFSEDESGPTSAYEFLQEGFALMRDIEMSIGGYVEYT